MRCLPANPAETGGLCCFPLNTGDHALAALLTSHSPVDTDHAPQQRLFLNLLPRLLTVGFAESRLTPVSHSSVVPLKVCVCAKLLQLCLTVPAHGLQPTSLLCSWDSPGKDTGVGCHALLHGIFPAQGPLTGHLHLLHLLPALVGGSSTTTTTWEAPPEVCFIVKTVSTLTAMVQSSA